MTDGCQDLGLRGSRLDQMKVNRDAAKRIRHLLLVDRSERFTKPPGGPGKG